MEKSDKTALHPYLLLNLMNYSLVALLSDGLFHSGVELGNQLGISRAAVSKNVAQLIQGGFVIESVKGVGYRLTESIVLVDKDDINDALSETVRARVQDLVVLPEVDSTNTFIKKCSHHREGFNICLAERQLNGRGRRGRSWVSPFGKNIYFSMSLYLNTGFESLSGLSLAVGVAVVNALASFGIDGVGLKWPNDVWINDKKVAGILLELEGEQEGPVRVVVGVGINVNMELDDTEEISQPWTSLSLEAGKPFDRNKLISELVNNLVEMVDAFKSSGFDSFKTEWDRHDALKGRAVVLSSVKNIIEGVYLGVDDQGMALLRSQGETTAYGAGELSLRVAK